KEIKSGDELVNVISATKPGNKINLNYIRNNQQKQAAVTVVDRAKLFADRSEEGDETAEDNAPAPTRLGISVRSLSPEMAQRMGVSEGKGVVVTDVKPGSFGEDIGMLSGDVILQVNRQSVNSEEDYRKLTSQLKSGQDVAFLIHRGRGAGAGNIFLSGT